jgi:phosphomannomutase
MTSGTEPPVRITVEFESLKSARKIMRKAVALVKQLVRKEEN